MTLQTNYSSATLTLGGRGTTIPDTTVSRFVEGAAIGFGKVVVQGAADNGIAAPGAGNTKYVGITALSPAARGTNDTYAVGESAAVITLGDVVVTVAEAVVAGDPVYFVSASGNIVKTASGNVLIAGARFETSAGSGALAIVRLG
jgi:hypothetical protein